MRLVALLAVCLIGIAAASAPGRAQNAQEAGTITGFRPARVFDDARPWRYDPLISNQESLITPAEATRYAGERTFYENYDRLSEDQASRSLAVGRLAILYRLGDLTGASFCTASLVAPKIVLTAGHCIPGNTLLYPGLEVARAHMTFGDVLNDLTDTTQRVAVVNVLESDVDLDYALLELESAPVGIQPLTIPAQRATTVPMVIVQYPYGLPMRIARLSCGPAGIPPEHNRLNHTCSTDGASSGAPIFTARNFDLIGIHQQGSAVSQASQFNTGTTLTALIAASPILRSLIKPVAPVSPSPATVVAPVVTQDPEPVAPSRLPEPAEERNFIVFFDWDSSSLNAEARDIVSHAAHLFRTRPDATILVVGHTDAEGAEAYNIGMSQRMARSVADALVAQGVYGDKISLQALGESDPAVPTADGVREPFNRRVEIIVRLP